MNAAVEALAKLPGVWRGGELDRAAPPGIPTGHAGLDRESLRQIAGAGGGEYFELGHEPDRDVAFRIIESVKRRAVTSVGRDANHASRAESMN